MSELGSVYRLEMTVLVGWALNANNWLTHINQSVNQQSSQLPQESGQTSAISSPYTKRGALSVKVSSWCARHYASARTAATWGRYHGDRRPSSDDSLRSPIVIPPSALEKTEYHEALPSSVNVQSHLTSSFAVDGNASWYSVCWVTRLEWRLSCENCRHLTVVGLHDTGPCWAVRIQIPRSCRLAAA